MSELERTLDAFANQAARPQGLMQLALIAAALGAGWLVARVLRRRVSGQGRWHFGEGGFDRVAFPLAALGVLLAVRPVVARTQATAFVNVAIALLVAFAVIRFSLYVLRYILPQGALLRGSERTVGVLMWILVALHVTGLLPEIRDALDAVNFTVGKQRISLLLVLQAIVSVTITLAISMWVARVIEGRVLASEKMEMSTRVVIAKLVYAVAFLAAILITLPVVGIDITALSVFGGALGVGLGFGLQKVASNYVSGFIILLDHSVRIGDLVTVDSRHGVVTAIASRYTVVRSLDGTESIVPNETMITQSVTNHSFSDRKVLVRVPVTVGYDSDVDSVFAILFAAAKHQQRILAVPAPAAWIANLGDNGIEIEMGVWISDPDQGQAMLRGEILREALVAFRGAGIEIPFPKREVRILGPANVQP